MNIQNMIGQYIKESGNAHLETKDGDGGVVFHDENQFIPFGDLGYNRQYGFYQISHLPDIHNEAGVNFGTVVFTTNDGKTDYRQWGIVTDDYTDGFIIGEWGSVVKVYEALKNLVETGQADEETTELDERLGHPWLDVTEAVEFARDRLGVEIADRRIRYACDNGAIRQAEKNGGMWRFPQRTFMSWVHNRPKPGPKPQK